MCSRVFIRLLHIVRLLWDTRKPSLIFIINGKNIFTDAIVSCTVLLGTKVPLTVLTAVIIFYTFCGTVVYTDPLPPITTRTRCYDDDYCTRVADGQSSG
jgi:hypothetical protein